MKRATINKLGKYYGHFETDGDVEAELDGRRVPAWGRNERWVSEQDLASEGKTTADAIDTRTSEVLGESRTEYKLAAEYTIVVTDLATDNAYIQEQYLAKRQAEYLKEGVTEQAMNVAMWEKVMEGRPEAADALQAKRALVKQRVPKPTK